MDIMINLLTNKMTRLQATWIKPEVVATKKYTGCLHYRFITTGSRFLWSPCCSYNYVFFFSSCVSLPIVDPAVSTHPFFPHSQILFFRPIYFFCGIEILFFKHTHQQTSNVNVTDVNVFVVHGTYFLGQLHKSNTDWNIKRRKTKN